MSDDHKGGSDLDIFEGLGKKSSERTAATPPPPPGSAQHVAARPVRDVRKTLVGIPGPAQGQPHSRHAQTPPPPPPATVPSGSRMPAAAAARPSAPPAPPTSGSMRVAQPATPSKPPPPPGRGSLPEIAAQPASQPPAAVARPTSQPPMPAPTSPSTRPSATHRVASPSAPPAANTRPGPAGALKNGKLEMDWDDDDEATHVFDKDDKENTGEHAAAAPARAAVAAVPAAPVTTPTAAAPPPVPKEQKEQKEQKEPERADMDAILSSPPPPPRASSQVPPPLPAAGTPPPPPAASAPATLSGAFASLGQSAPATNGASSSHFKSGPPASQSMRSAPPAPPGSSSTRPPSASTTTHPMPPPPPPPPGQTTTAPMHMPARPVSQPPPAHAQMPSQPPGHPSGHHPSAHPSGHHASGHHASGHHASAHHASAAPHGHVSAPPAPHLPPVARNMEATAVVPRQPSSSKAPLIVALFLLVAAVAGAAVYMLMPRTGTIVVNVADTRGAAVSRLEILVDGTKKCDTAPCIVPNVSAGVHEVKVLAPGFEPLAPLAVTVESRKDVEKSFTLVPARTSGGTGFKVAGNQPGVKLVVDGKDIGPLPQELRDLEPGEHKVRFVGGDRYAPLEKTISIGKDEVVDLGTVALKVLKGKATIQLGTPGAKVYLVLGTNRKEVPQFPMGIEFDPNERWILEATKDGHEDFKQPITWDDGLAEKTFTVTLTPKGHVAVTAPAWQPPHATPAAQPAAAAQPAPAAQPAAAKPTGKEPPSFLKGDTSGSGDTAAAPATKPEAPKKEAAAPAAGEAFLNINSLPASTVVLDGKPLGPTPRLKVSVSPGSHTIMFVNAEQSLKKSITVDVKAGETKAAFAKLRE